MKPLVRVALAALAIAIGAVFAVLWAWSLPGQPRPYRDANGATLENSISEKIFVEINGALQGMFIKSKDRSKPVLLYLHGGMPDYFLADRFNAGLEDLFTVCWWEQRGAGLSYDPAAAPGSVHFAQLVSDALAVTDSLRRRFDQPRIYLMGHSGGTFLGMHAIARAPERFVAYIAVAQITDQLQSEVLAYNYMRAQFRESGNAAMLRRLEENPVRVESGVPSRYYAVRDEAMHRLGIGTMREMRSVVSGLLLASLRCPDYTLSEKIRLWRGKAASGVSSMWEEILRSRLGEQIPDVKVPVYFFHGVHDYTCSYTLAQTYFDALHAPLKGFYTFSASAHSPIFEEPEKARRILREDVLNGVNTLADHR